MLVTMGELLQIMVFVIAAILAYAKLKGKVDMVINSLGEIQAGFKLYVQHELSDVKENLQKEIKKDIKDLADKVHSYEKILLEVIRRNGSRENETKTRKSDSSH